MTKHTAEQALTRRPLLTPYAIVWSMFGLLGLGYLGVAIFAPDVLEELTPPSRLAERQRAENDAALLRVSTEINGLRNTFAQMQIDVAKLKSDATASTSQAEKTDGRITALEDQIRQMAEPPAKVSQNDAADDGKAGAPASKQASAQKPRIINSSDNSSIETGSVDTKAKADSDHDTKKASKNDVISFGPAVVKPAPKPIGIRVASGSSIDGLRLSWSLLSERHDALKTLNPLYVDSGDAINPSFDLMAGPVKTKAEAVRLCRKLNAKNVPCTVGEFKGAQL